MADEVSGLLARFGPVEELEITDELCDHLGERGSYAKHVVTVAEIREVHDREPRYFFNPSTTENPRRAPIIMVGPTVSDRLLVIPLEPSGRYGVWRPVTAFEANAHHRRRYAKEDEQ